MSSLEDLGENIRNIVLSSSKKVNINELFNLYSHSYDQSLDFKKFGFKTLRECLESLANYVKIQRNGYQIQLVPVVSEKFLDYENLISAPNRTVKGYEKRSRAIIMRGSDRSQNTQTETSSVNLSKLDLSSIMEAEREVLESSYNDSVSDTTKNGGNKYETDNNSSSMSQSSRYFIRPNDQTRTKKQQVFHNEIKTRSWIKSENFNGSVPSEMKIAVESERPSKPTMRPSEAVHKKRFMSDDLRQKLFDLLAEHETGIWLTEIFDLFERKYNESLRKFLGTDTILTYCNDHTDVFQLERFRCGWRTFSTKQVIPDNLHELVSSHPIEVLNMRKKKQLDDVVVNALPDDFDLSDYVNDTSFAQATKTHNLVGVTGDHNLITPPPSPPPPHPLNDTRAKNNYHQLKLIYPTDVAVQHDFVKKPLIPTDWCKFRCLFEIKILEITSPSQFWICISKREVYNDIIDQVERFYKEKCNLYAMKICHVCENHYCVVSYAKNEKENAFRRCKIVSFNAATESVKVFLIDMGIEISASINSIYYLRKEFLDPLQQAIPVQLHGYGSGNGIWQMNETRIFRELTRNSRLYAAFKRVTDKKHIEVELFAYNNATNNYINVATELTTAIKSI